MMTVVYDEKVTCPVCGSNKFLKFYYDDGCYVCKNYIGDERAHSECAAVYCKTCNRISSKNKFASIHYGGTSVVFECKECGRKNWGLTEIYNDYINFLTRSKHTYTEENEI